MNKKIYIVTARLNKSTKQSIFYDLNKAQICFINTLLKHQGLVMAYEIEDKEDLSITIDNYTLTLQVVQENAPVL